MPEVVPSPIQSQPYFHIAGFRRDADKKEALAKKLQEKALGKIREQLAAAQNHTAEIAALAAAPILSPLANAERLVGEIHTDIQGHLAGQLAPIVVAAQGYDVPNAVSPPAPAPVRSQARPAVVSPPLAVPSTPPAVLGCSQSWGDSGPFPNSHASATNPNAGHGVRNYGNADGTPCTDSEFLRGVTATDARLLTTWLPDGSASTYVIPSGLTIDEWQEFWSPDPLTPNPEIVSLTDANLTYVHGFRSRSTGVATVSENLPGGVIHIEPPPPPPPECDHWELWRHRYKPGVCQIICVPRDTIDCPELWEHLEDCPTEEECQRKQRCDPRCQCQPDTKVWICNPSGGTQECPPPQTQDLCGVGVYQHQLDQTCMDDYRQGMIDWYSDWWDQIKDTQTVTQWGQAVMAALPDAEDWYTETEPPE